jgi:NADPH:quinone reductase-like Zn-dependent oxidoreductase
VTRRGRLHPLTHESSSNGNNNEDGAFAEYIVAKGDLQIKIPDNVKDTDAATLGVSVTTCVSLETLRMAQTCEAEDTDREF